MIDKHTPGPWTWAGVTHVGTGASPDRGDGTGFYHVADSDGKSICRLEEQPTANARLIAAAPELLEACRELQDALLSHDGNLSDPMDRGGWQDPGNYIAFLLSQTAIAKAEGRT